MIVARRSTASVRPYFAARAARVAGGGRPSPRRSRGGLLRVALACGLLCGAMPTAFAQDLLPTARELRAAGLETAWWGVASVAAGRGRVTELTADEDAVYVQTTGNLLTAIDLTTGAKKWVTRVGRAGQTAVRVNTTPGGETEPGLVIIGVGRTAYAVNKDSGEIEWELPLAETAGAPLTIAQTDDGPRLFVPTVTGNVYCYDLDLIEEFHLEQRLAEFSSGTERWRYDTSAPIVGPVAVDGIAAVFANNQGALFGLSTEKRKLLWRFETNGRATAPLVAYEGTAYLASEDRNLYAVNIQNGLDRWEFVTREPVQIPPAIVKGAVYVTPVRSGVYRVDRDTGRSIWRAERAKGFLTQTADRVYLSDRADNVVALNLADGRQVGSARLTQFKVRAQNPLTDRVIVATETGIVLCLKPAGAGFPIYYAHPERRPVEPAFAEEAPADPPAGN